MNIREEENLCEEWGLRKTKTRLLLFEVLKESPQPLAIPELLELFIVRKHRINKTTLYREIESLVDLGAIRAVQITPRKTSYELASHEHHHHFVCTSCDAVTDVQFPEESIQKTEALLEKQGVTISRHSLEFFGLCKTCN
jgi:Fur family transcriptional regulator, ferric uptake regulator